MTEADDSAHAAKTIDALVEALEKIEAMVCPFLRYASSDRVTRCYMCPACIAHDALTLFRGQ